MPQPDNRRERGAKTQTSQQTVAPQGQMPGTISPISGGAASAAPVLQIGQQAQIKKTGAELYQAIAGVAQGVQQGIQNYEKMYQLVSETQYADFETSYIQENDRVKGDPAKMKVWMDNQTYKPNRLTAKKFNMLRAEVNGKAYDEEERDVWAGRQKTLATLPPHEAMKELSTFLAQTDENSPVYREMEASLNKYSSTVAAVTHRQQATIMENNFRSQNMATLEAITKTNPDMPLDDPNIETILTARSLGQLTISNDGTVTMADGSAEFQLSAIPSQVIQKLQDTAGMTSDPMEITSAMRAANLPASMKNGSSGGKVDPIQLGITMAAASVGTNAPTGLRTAVVGSLPEDASVTDMANAFAAGARELIGSRRSTAEKAAGLGAMIDALDPESSSAIFAGRTNGDTPEEIESATRQIREQLNEQRTVLMQTMTAEARDATMQGLSTATSEAQTRTLLNAYAERITPLLAEMGYDATMYVERGPEGQRTGVKMTFAEYSEAVKEDPSLSLMQVMFEDPELGLGDVPFAVETESGVIFGSSSDKTALANNPLSASLIEMQKAMQEVRVIADFKRNPSVLAPADRAVHMSELIERNPQEALDLAFNNPGTALLTGTLTEPARTAMRAVLFANEDAGRELLMDSNPNAPGAMKILGFDQTDSSSQKNLIRYRFTSGDTPQERDAEANKLYAARQALEQTGFSTAIDNAFKNFQNPDNSSDPYVAEVKAAITASYNKMFNTDLTFEEVQTKDQFMSAVLATQQMLKSNGNMMMAAADVPNFDANPEAFFARASGTGFIQMLPSDPTTTTGLRGGSYSPARDAVEAIRAEGKITDEALLGLTGVRIPEGADSAVYVNLAFSDQPRAKKIEQFVLFGLQEEEATALVNKANDLFQFELAYDQSVNAQVDFIKDEEENQTAQVFPIVYYAKINSDNPVAVTFNQDRKTIRRAGKSRGDLPNEGTNKSTTPSQVVSDAISLNTGQGAGIANMSSPDFWNISLNFSDLAEAVREITSIIPQALGKGSYAPSSRKVMQFKDLSNSPTQEDLARDPELAAKLKKTAEETFKEK